MNATTTAVVVIVIIVVVVQFLLLVLLLMGLEGEWWGAVGTVDIVVKVGGESSENFL